MRTSRPTNHTLVARFVSMGTYLSAESTRLVTKSHHINPIPRTKSSRGQCSNIETRRNWVAFLRSDCRVKIEHDQVVWRDGCPSNNGAWAWNEGQIIGRLEIID